MLFAVREYFNGIFGSLYMCLRKFPMNLFFTLSFQKRIYLFLIIAIANSCGTPDSQNKIKNQRNTIYFNSAEGGLVLREKPDRKSSNAGYLESDSENNGFKENFDNELVTHLKKRIKLLTFWDIIPRISN